MSEEQPLLDALTASTGFQATQVAQEHHLVPDPVHDARNIPLSRSSKLILGSLYIHIFLGALDTTIVATLLTVIASDLDALPHMLWVATLYLLSCLAFQPLFGKILDIFGRKRCLLVCNLMFAAGCLVCSTCDSLYVLSVGRFVTGIGGGGFNTLGTIIMSDIVPLRDRGMYQGYGNIAFGLGAASGGVIAGWFPSWRHAFGFQVPVCCAAGLVILVCMRLPHKENHKREQVDVFGLLLLVSALMMLMLAMSRGVGNSVGFWGLLTSSIILLVVFYQFERRQVSPVIPVNLLHDRTVLALLLNCFFILMTVMANLYITPFFWLLVKNLGASAAGARLVSNFIGVSVGLVFAGHYMRHYGRYYTLALVSGALGVIGLVMLLCLAPSLSSLYELVVMGVPGFAMAVMITVLLVAMLAAVEKKEHALVTLIQYGFRSVGCTVGVSLATAIFEAVLAAQLERTLGPFRSEMGSQLIDHIIDKAKRNSSYAFYDAPQFAIGGILKAYDVGCHAALVYGLVCSIGGALCNVFLRDKKI